MHMYLLTIYTMFIISIAKLCSSQNISRFFFPHWSICAYACGVHMYMYVYIYIHTYICYMHTHTSFYRLRVLVLWAKMLKQFCKSG